MPVSSSDIRFIIRTACVKLSRYTWFNDHARESTLYLGNPNMNFPKTTSLPRRFDTLFHRVQLEVAYTKTFLFQIQSPSSPDCGCGHVAEDVEDSPLSSLFSFIK